MRSAAVLRALAGLVFPLAEVAALAALLARLAGEPIAGALVGAAFAVLLLGVVVAAALTTLAVVRRQWWWAGGLLMLWPVTVPLYLRHLRRPGDARGGAAAPDAHSEDPEV